MDVGPPLEVVEKYKETLKKYPNPPAANAYSLLTDTIAQSVSCRLRAVAPDPLVGRREKATGALLMSGFGSYCYALGRRQS